MDISDTGSHGGQGGHGEPPLRVNAVLFVIPAFAGMTALANSERGGFFNNPEAGVALRSYPFPGAQAGGRFSCAAAMPSCGSPV